MYVFAIFIICFQLNSKLQAQEKRLEYERVISKQLKEILSKAVQSQEMLQALESEANSNLAKTEAKLAVSTASEEAMKQQITSLE